jgi:hypothetical protein
MTNDSRSNPSQSLTVLPDDMLDQVAGGILPIGPVLGTRRHKPVLAAPILLAAAFTPLCVPLRTTFFRA